MGRYIFLVIAVGIAVGLMMPSDMHVAMPSPDRPQERLVTVSGSGVGAEASSAARNQPSPMNGQMGVTVLRREANGHFFTRAAVNGIDVNFLVDTGASGVSLTMADAQAIGLQFSPEEFDVIGSGASGPVRGKLITLDRVSLDGRTVESVQGAILEGGQMSLLGQSFLAQMGRIEIAGDEMIIR